MVERCRTRDESKRYVPYALHSKHVPVTHVTRASPRANTLITRRLIRNRISTELNSFYFLLRLRRTLFAGCARAGVLEARCTKWRRKHAFGAARIRLPRLVARIARVPITHACHSSTVNVRDLDTLHKFGILYKAGMRPVRVALTIVTNVQRRVTLGASRS